MSFAHRRTLESQLDTMVGKPGEILALLLLGTMAALSQTSAPPPPPTSPPSSGGLFWGLDRKGNPTLVSSSGVAEGEEKTPMELRNEEVSQDLSSTLKQHTVGGLYAKVALDRGNRAGNRMHDNAYKSSAAAQLDISRLRNVLRIDEAALTAVVEPLVSMRRLVDATLPLGLLPKVVPEFKQITVGGAIMGAALESSSHRHGQFLDSCKSATVLLPDGTIVMCSREENNKLFNSLSGSFGTLAILLKAEVCLQRVQPFVKVTYDLFPTPESAIGRIKSLCASPSPPEFIEGVYIPESWGGRVGKGCPELSKNRTVVMHADFTAAPSGIARLCAECYKGGGCMCAVGGKGIVRTDAARGEWFSEHVARVAAKASTGEGQHSEIIPTREYLFRYDYGAFWMARPMQFWSSHTRLTPASVMLFLMSSPVMRFLFGPAFSTKTLFSALKRAPREVVAEKMVVMDVYMPIDSAASLIHRVSNSVPISTPLWLCPVKGSEQRQPLSPHGHSPGLFCNVGIYGRVCDSKGVSYSRALEEYAAAHGGRKMLYSQNFYTEGEFWGRDGGVWGMGAMYDEAEYSRLRQLYSADKVLPDLYSKVCEGARAPPPQSLWSACKRALCRMIL